MLPATRSSLLFGAGAAPDLGSRAGWVTRTVAEAGRGRGGCMRGGPRGRALLPPTPAPRPQGPRGLTAAAKQLRRAWNSRAHRSRLRRPPGAVDACTHLP